MNELENYLSQSTNNLIEMSSLLEQATLKAIPKITAPCFDFKPLLLHELFNLQTVELVSILSKTIDQVIESITMDLRKITEQLSIKITKDMLKTLSEITDRLISVYAIGYTGEVKFDTDKEKEKIILQPNTIVKIDLDLLIEISKNPSLLYVLNSREFEQFIGEIFRRYGFEVELTKETRDGGMDVVAYLDFMNTKLKYLIECKHYKIGNKVSLDIVQRFYGVKISENANKGIIVTSSSFTRYAQQFALKHYWDLELKDYRNILEWLEKIKNV